MATIAELRKRIAPYKNQKALLDIIFKIVKDNEKIFLSLNKQQLQRGKNNLDGLVGTYTRTTELASLFDSPKPIQPKVEGQPYNFEWTGEWFDNFFLEIQNEEATISSSGDSHKALISKYDGLFGLDDTNKFNVIRNTVFPEFMKEFRRRIGLNVR